MNEATKQPTTPNAATAEDKGRCAPAPCSATPCHRCAHLLREPMFCRFLQHYFENGYAMLSHARTCGGYTPLQPGESYCPICLGGKVYDGRPCWNCKGKGTVQERPAAGQRVLIWLARRFGFKSESLLPNSIYWPGLPGQS